MPVDAINALKFGVHIYLYLSPERVIAKADKLDLKTALLVAANAQYMSPKQLGTIRQLRQEKAVKDVTWAEALKHCKRLYQVHQYYDTALYVSNKVGRISSKALDQNGPGSTNHQTPPVQHDDTITVNLQDVELAPGPHSVELPITLRGPYQLTARIELRPLKDGPQASNSQEGPLPSDGQAGANTTNDEVTSVKLNGVIEMTEGAATALKDMLEDESRPASLSALEEGSVSFCDFTCQFTVGDGSDSTSMTFDFIDDTF
ncbi:hypothetical protein BV20DRAFT_1057310 [Pilatotrama ljubarskyi]|nr:hypothetical protein BV20DRAFT_1058353 [Pilatotrama ljubarskyi]KAI0364334.1 hypothetical protein BV20DRAFT_1057310 [Pilatotrama ljubarskyi]